MSAAASASMPSALPPASAWRIQCIPQFLVFLLILATAVVVNHAPLWHTDIWAHLKFGQHIVEDGRLPEGEPFVAWIPPAVPYSASCWLSQVVFYQVFHFGENLVREPARVDRWAGGVEMLRLLHSLLVFAKFSLLAWAFRRLSHSWGVTLALVAVSIVFSLGSLFVLRPQLFGEVGFALLLAVLARPYPSLFATFFGMPVVFFLWSNLHGSFLVGLITLLGFALGRMLNLCIRFGVHPKHYWNDHRFHRFVPMMYLSVLLIGFFHPDGFQLFADVYTFGKNPNVQAMEEWQPLAWPSPWAITFLVSLLLVLATHLTGLVVPPPADRPDRQFGPIPLGQLILLACFGVQTFSHQRMMPWWTMLVPWICAGPWGHVVSSLKRAEPPPTRGLNRLASAVVIVIWLGLAGWFSGPGMWLATGQPRPLESAVHSGTPLPLVMQLSRDLSRPLPVLAEWLERNASGGFPGRIFASETQGDFLIWALSRRMAPPIYTHVHLFSPDHWQRIHALKHAAAGWDHLLREWKVNLVVIEAEHHPRLRQLLRAEADWLVVLDEFGQADKADARGRHFIAVRKQPLR